MAKSTTTFKDTTTNFRSLMAEIDNKSYHPIYLLMGEEGYFIDKLSDAIAGKVLTEAEKAFNQIVVYGKDSDAGAIINMCRQMPMMGNYQVVIIKEAQQLKKIEQLALYAQHPSPSTILVICHKDKNLDKRSQLYKHISKCGATLESVKPRDYEISTWLTDHIRSRGCNIEPKALNMLTDHLGTQIDKISNELTKLLTYLPEGTTTITADHIEQNIGISKDFNNYELTKAISDYNVKKALLIADHFARNPKSNPLVVTISTLFTHFQRIFIINYQIWNSRRRNQPMASDADLCRMLRVPSPFFLKEYKAAATRFPNKKVYNILGYIREYDLRSKGMNNGDTSEKELLRELILKIFMG